MKGVKKASKSKDPRRADEWSVRQYPYVTYKRNGPHPTYHQSLGKAKAWIEADVEKFRKQFAFLNQIEVVLACEEVVKAVRGLPERGGSVEMVIDPTTLTRYHVELIKRKQAP